MRRREFVCGLGRLSIIGPAALTTSFPDSAAAALADMPAAPNLDYVFAVASRVCRIGARNAPHAPEKCWTDYPVVFFGSKPLGKLHHVQCEGIGQPLVCSRPVEPDSLTRLAQLSRGLTIGNQVVTLQATTAAVVFFYQRQVQPESRLKAAEQCIEQWREALNVPELTRA